MLKIIVLISVTMPLAASSPLSVVRNINPHRHTTETITITVDKDSPSKNNSLADTLNSLSAHRADETKQVRISAPCCNTKVKLAIVAMTGAVLTAGIGAAVTYYSKTCAN